MALVDDDAALEAALSFLDDFVPSAAARQGSLSPLTDDSNNSNDSGVCTTPKAKRASTATPTARQMEKLQIDLEVLKTRQAQEQQQKEKDEANATALGLAEQQKRRREETERDNVLLRLAVERQTKVADSLRSLMQKRAVQLTNEFSLLMTLARSKHHVVDVLRLGGDLDDFHGLFQRLEASYRRLDEVFMANGLAGTRISPVDVHVREGVDGNFFELSAYKTLPFDVRSTAEASWRHFKGVEKHQCNGSLYTKAEKTDLNEPFTLISDFKKEIVSNSSRADIRVKQAIRHYVEEDRDIIAWTSRADLCYMISIDRDIETTYGVDDARTITDFMIVSIGQNLRAHREFIENALVDQALSSVEMALLDDDNAFEAALSFLNDETLLPLHNAHESSPSQTTQTQTQVQVPARQRSEEEKLRRKKEFNEKRKMLRRTGVYGDPNRSRNERKKEIAVLREQLQKVEGITEVWQEMAARQRLRREEAESENIRLKVVVEQQQKVADSLRSLLRKRATHLMKEYSAFTDPAFTRHYIDRLDTMLLANGLANMTISPGDVHIREDFDGKYMEFFTYKELPFGLQETQEVAWDHWKGMERATPYTIIEDFTKELFSNCARADVQVKQVIRRYVEGDRDIIIWVARLTPVEIKHKMLRGLTYNLRGQVVIKRSPHSTPDQEVSVLQQCSLIYLDHEARLRYDPSSLRALQNASHA
ncbi:hypothetical protein PHYSODRAFT_321631 [Phytophthora sojae]|uniref:M96 mating-specific protein family n=1 Tax=Phytophthora sojae (strain P6497) TaxID=1094619 RepID=G4YPD6_PHYSP|nr:hypothetical protein PHYSODRAFT_321631 [Phytophthora sojae]EGZ27916.1 hypothetical protein PHYSODRAFT_321631 [Phytophthora sojae]|eukprot:XP_009515191.1 hypothetical protein PHYSODRAFT_321631 [Phytophthora sojae]